MDLQRVRPRKRLVDRALSTLPAFAFRVAVLCFLAAIAYTLPRILLELQRVNANLENIYFEMPWSEETYDAYCAENPADCEITE